MLFYKFLPKHTFISAWLYLYKVVRMFIDNLTTNKLQACGLNPFDGKLNKGYMLSLLNATGKFDIKLESPYNYEK